MQTILSGAEEEWERYAVPFTAGSVGGGLSTLVVCLYFQHAWRAKGKPVPIGYKEVAPVWAFEANAWIAGVWTPVGLLWGLWECWAAVQEGTPLLDVINTKTAFDVVVFGVLFGIMVKDFALFYDTPDLVLLMHHICVMFISLVLCFLSPIHAVRLCTLSALVVEMGSSCYCIYVAYRQLTPYKYGMTISNVFFMTTIYLWCSSNHGIQPELSSFAAFPTTSLVIGRQVVLHLEIQRESRLSKEKCE